jgi:hypothetical protein
MARMTGAAYLADMQETRAMKEATKAAMGRRAVELAQSAEHHGYASIATAIRQEFGCDPGFLFQHSLDKRRFDEMCQAAVRKRASYA